MFEQKQVVVTSPPPSLLQSIWESPPPAPIAPPTVTTIGRKGNLYGMVNVQPLSEEMLISPKLLDFLEQALEPIAIEPARPSQSKLSAAAATTESSIQQRLDDTVTSLTTGGSSGSMPIDIVVFVCVQPSRMRFTCLPVSRVQCLIKIPSLDFVFSTQKKSDSEGTLFSSSQISPKKPPNKFL